jgi:hypothetical protein
MPTKDDKNGSGFGGFVNIRLESHHKKEIKEEAQKIDDAGLFVWLCEMADDGYKFSLSPDEENGAMIATLVGSSCIGDNMSLAMSQRHSDPRIAVVALRYAHKTIAGGQSWEAVAYDWREVDW